VPLQQPPWRQAYDSLRLSRLDRLTRFFGWRLLHGALRCSATAVLAVVQGGHGAGVAGCGVLLSHGLRWG
jgi:hypothetical protein